MIPANAIEIRGLTKSYQGRTAVEGLDLTVTPGEIFGLLGPNGAGKTTAIRTVLTLLKPNAGTVTVWGFDTVAQARDVRQVLGYVPQEKAVDRFLTGREHLELVAALYHLSKEDSRRRIAGVLDLVALADKADEVVTNYSGGMKKKLDIACGLIGNPKVLIMDEPTLGLDVESRIRIWDYIRRLKKDGITIVMTTNYLDEAENLCDRIGILDRGRLVALGTPEALKRGLGGDRILIRLVPAPGNLDDVVRALQTELGFIRAVKLDTTRRELDLRVVSNEEALPPLIQKLHDHGQAIEAIQYSRPTLEDVFVTYAGHRIHETAALA